MLLVLTALLLAVWCASAAARAPVRGAQVHALWWDHSDSDMDRELDLARAAGATALRIDIAWGNIEEAGKGQYTPWYVAKLDRFVAGAAQRGIGVLAVLWATPCWASSAPDSLRLGCAPGWWERGVASYPPRNASDYADIARWLTSRYGTRLAALEVWNEPNLASGYFWKASDPAGAYATLLKSAYPAAKAGNSSVPVLAGSLSGSDRAFLGRLYAAGARGFYDGLAVHPYADPGFVALKAFRTAQLVAGDTAPIWATEFGWPTGSDPQWHVSQVQQATEIRQAFGALDALPWVVGATLYELRDSGTNPLDMEQNFGVLTQGFVPKPGYSALTLALAGV